MTIRLALLWLLLPSLAWAQSPIALHTSDSKFAPRSEVIPRPTTALAFGSRWPSYSAGTRKAGQYEIAYCLVDEAGALSPRSPSVTINPKVTDWDVVVSTPGLDLWSRAIGTLWQYKPAGGSWQVLGCNQNAQISSQCTRPFIPLCGWNHSLGGFQLFFAPNWPALSDAYWKQSTTLTAPPVPAVRLLCCPNIALEIAYSWACNEGETPLSDITTIAVQPNEPANKHCPFQVYRNIIPPNGALGTYVYLRKPGQQWYRQLSHYADGSYLWPIDSNQFPVNEFTETGVVADTGKPGRSYLSSIHLAMRDWGRDVIIDTDQEITCPVISAYDGPSWVYDPKNQQTAIGTNAFAYAGEGWKITVDGVTSGYLRPTANWQMWQAVSDKAFGAGNVQIQYGSGFGGAIISFTGKYAATDMTGRVTYDFSKMYQINTNDGSQPLKDGAGNPIPFPFVTVPGYEQAARSWYMGAGGQKFNRTIATSNGGSWNLKAKDGSGSWPAWVENSQRTRLIGCKITSDTGMTFVDHIGAGAFSFTAKVCAFTGKRYGARCTWTSRGPAWNNHSASEPYFENCSFQAKHPIVCEGGQSVNWLFSTTYAAGDLTIESALITQANAGAMAFKGRFNADSARSIGAMAWANKLDIEGIWIDQSIPSWFTITGNTFPSISINGTKINHWRDWLHVMEAPAGSIGYPVKLKLDNLDSQFNGKPTSFLASARADMLKLVQVQPVGLLQWPAVAVPVPVEIK